MPVFSSSSASVSGVGVDVNTKFSIEMKELSPLVACVTCFQAATDVIPGQTIEIRVRAGTTIGVGVTGVAGPGGGSAEKPVGTVHIAVASPAGTHERQFSFPGERERVRWWASQAALDMVRRELMKM